MVPFKKRDKKTLSAENIKKKYKPYYKGRLKPGRQIAEKYSKKNAIRRKPNKKL